MQFNTQGFMAATSWKRAGNSAYLAAREITIRPDSIGSRSTSSQLREENARLKKLVIDLSLGKAILADVIKKSRRAFTAPRHELPGHRRSRGGAVRHQGLHRHAERHY